jgi:hypothetical protein
VIDTYVGLPDWVYTKSLREMVKIIPGLKTFQVALCKAYLHIIVPQCQVSMNVLCNRMSLD